MTPKAAASRALGWLVPRLLAALPPRRRFGFARTLAFGAALLPPRHGSNKPLLNRREHWLKTLLDRIDHAHVRYDLPLEVMDHAVLREAVRRGNGVLLVGLHEPLNFLPVRLLHEDGHPYLIISHGTRVVPGAAAPVPVEPPSRTFMLTVRRRLKAGHIVGAMLEAKASSPMAMKVVAPQGPIFVSGALFELARKCGAEVVFVSTRLDRDGRVAINFGAPSAASQGDAAKVTEDFVRFVQPRLAA